MRDYAKISCSIWQSRKFRSLQDDDARLLYFYLHTSPNVNSVGCYVLPGGYAVTDLGWDAIRYRKAIDRLSIAQLIAFDPAENLVRIIDYLKHDPFTNPKHAAGAVKIALALPEVSEKATLLRDILTSKHVPESPEITANIDRLSKGYRNPEPLPLPEPLSPEAAVGRANGHAPPPNPPPEIAAAAPPNRIRFLEAMGIGPDGVTGPSSFIGTQGDMAEAAKWAGLGLSDSQQIGVITEICQRQRAKQAGWMPKRFSYFSASMADLAVTKASPVPPGSPSHSQADREQQAKRERWNKVGRTAP